MVGELESPESDDVGRVFYDAMSGEELREDLVKAGGRVEM